MLVPSKFVSLEFSSLTKVSKSIGPFSPSNSLSRSSFLTVFGMFKLEELIVVVDAAGSVRSVTLPKEIAVKWLLLMPVYSLTLS